MDVAASSQAVTNSVVVHDLLGAKAQASVITTHSSVTQAPSSSDPGWQTLVQTLGHGFGEKVFWVRMVIDVPQAFINTPMVLQFFPPVAHDVTFFLTNGDAIALGSDSLFDQRMLGFTDAAASFVPTVSPTTIDIRLATS